MWRRTSPASSAPSEALYLSSKKERPETTMRPNPSSAVVTSSFPVYTVLIRNKLVVTFLFFMILFLVLENFAFFGREEKIVSNVESGNQSTGVSIGASQEKRMTQLQWRSKW
jgi:hypothetical protein